MRYTQTPYARSFRAPLLGVAALTTAWLALGSLAACGSEEACTTLGCPGQGSDAPAGTGGSGGSENGPLGNGDIFGEDVGNDPNDGPLGDGEACRAVRFDAATNPVNVLILLDRSVSMDDPVDRSDPASPTRWSVVTDALRAFVNSDQAAAARVGIQFFGLTAPQEEDCNAAKYMVPRVEIGPLAENRQALIGALDGTLPGSFTPTAPAVEGALAYALSVAQLPENAGIPTVLVVASDVMPSQCQPTDENGEPIFSLGAVLDTLERYSTPELDAAGNPVQPPILTYVIGPQELRSNAAVLADAGGGQTFLVGGEGSVVFDQNKFLDALLSIVFKPLSCEIDVPQEAPDNGEQIDFERVRVRYTGASSGQAREFPRVIGPGSCGANDAWFYDDNASPTKIFFCRNACESLGAGDLTVELGCEPTLIPF